MKKKIKKDPHINLNWHKKKIRPTFSRKNCIALKLFFADNALVGRDLPLVALYIYWIAERERLWAVCGLLSAARRFNWCRLNITLTHPHNQSHMSHISNYTRNTISDDDGNALIAIRGTNVEIIARYVSNKFLFKFKFELLKKKKYLTISNFPRKFIYADVNWSLI